MCPRSVDPPPLEEEEEEEEEDEDPCRTRVVRRDDVAARGRTRGGREDDVAARGRIMDGGGIPRLLLFFSNPDFKLTVDGMVE